jgi:hypothetical protein
LRSCRAVGAVLARWLPAPSRAGHRRRSLRRPCVGWRGRGSFPVMETDILVRDVQEEKTRSGNTRYVIHDEQGREYTTFRPQIGQQARRYEGRHARIGYHEEDRGGFHNVYLDSITGSPQDRPEERMEGGDRGRAPGKNPDEIGWAPPWKRRHGCSAARSSKRPSRPNTSTESYGTSRTWSPATSVAVMKTAATTRADAPFPTAQPA